MDLDLQIIPKRVDIPFYDAETIKIHHIRCFDPPYQEYGEEEITKQIIRKISNQLSGGLNIYLSLNPDGEDDWLEVNRDGRWISLACSRDCGQDNSYSSAFADTAPQIMEADFSGKRIHTALESDGQSPIPKIQALTDKNPALAVNPSVRRYAKSDVGMQVLFGGGQLGFVPLAKALSQAVIKPVTSMTETMGAMTFTAGMRRATSIPSPIKNVISYNLIQEMIRVRDHFDLAPFFHP